MRKLLGGLLNNIKPSVKAVFSDSLYVVLAVSLAVNLLLIYYLVFLQTTTFAVFFASNNFFYNWVSIVLTALNSLLFGVAVAMVLFSWKKKQAIAGSTGNSALGVALGAISTGCPVCGAVLLPTLGIAGSLAAFPLQGMEIKLLSIAFLLWAVKKSSEVIAGVCPIYKEKLFTWGETHLVLNIKRSTLPQAKMGLVVGLSVLMVYWLPKLPASYKLSFAAKAGPSVTVDSIGREAGVGLSEYVVNASFGDLGPRLLASGAIDLAKFKQIYERSGRPLTDGQLRTLTQGSDEKIIVSEDSAYFLINFLWALGLNNKNPILDEGQMTKYGRDQIGSFASTGGWTVGSKPATELYSQSLLVVLTPAQQAIVDEAAEGTYRPCCGNSTAFPDCNHGMAMLGLYELMASQGATVGDLFEAGKYFNAFWFPQQYLDIATYFKAKEGKDFGEVDPKIAVSREFSSGGGWTNTRKWLASNNLLEEAPTGGGCGV